MSVIKKMIKYFNKYIYVLLMILLISCSSNEVKKKKLDTIVYDIIKSLYKNDKSEFASYFDAKLMSELSTSQFDYLYNNTTFILKNYSLPDYNKWVKYRQYYLEDTTQKTIMVGLPFISNLTSTIPDYTMILTYQENDLLSGFRIKKTLDAEDLSERSFPSKKDKLYFPLNNLIEIRLYYLEGLDEYSEKAKYIEFKDKTLNEKIISSFDTLFNTLGKSTILLTKKSSLHEIKNINNLVSINFTFKDKYEKNFLQIINPADDSKYLEVNHFYKMNAAYKYELLQEDKEKLNGIINLLKQEYIK